MSASKRVYFVKAKGMAGPIKIGCSISPPQRLLTLNNWCPYELELLCDAPGGFPAENALHWLFLESRLHGEWFSWSPKMAAVIEHVLAHGVLPDLPEPPPPASLASMVTKLPMRSVSVYHGRLKSNATRMINKAMRHVYGPKDWNMPPPAIAAIMRRYSDAREPSPTDAEWDVINAFYNEFMAKERAPCPFTQEASWLIHRRDNGLTLSPHLQERLEKLGAGL